MPRRSLLSNEQRTRLFAVPVDHAEMAKHYVLSADDLMFVRAKRRSVNRLGFAIELCLLRYPGQGLGAGELPPQAMIGFVAGFTHQRSKVERYARSGNCKASPTLRGAAVSNPERIVAKRV